MPQSLLTSSLALAVCVAAVDPLSVSRSQPARKKPAAKTKKVDRSRETNTGEAAGGVSCYSVLLTHTRRLGGDSFGRKVGRWSKQ